VPNAIPQDFSDIYYPCFHEGRCELGVCTCMKYNYNQCEKFCGCKKECSKKFKGCRCTDKSCTSLANCECAKNNRECDPDICSCYVYCNAK